MNKENCAEYWPIGVMTGFLVPCSRKRKHTGSHRNERGDLHWNRRLTQAEWEKVQRILASLKV